MTTEFEEWLINVELLCTTIHSFTRSFVHSPIHSFIHLCTFMRGDIQFMCVSLCLHAMHCSPTDVPFIPALVQAYNLISSVGRNHFRTDLKSRPTAKMISNQNQFRNDVIIISTMGAQPTQLVRNIRNQNVPVHSVYLLSKNVKYRSTNKINCYR